MTLDWPKLQDEVAPDSMEARGIALESACRAAFQILSATPDKERKLAFQEPLPESSVELIRQMPRKSYG